MGDGFFSILFQAVSGLRVDLEKSKLLLFVRSGECGNLFHFFVVELCFFLWSTWDCLEKLGIPLRKVFI